MDRRGLLLLFLFFLSIPVAHSVEGEIRIYDGNTDLYQGWTSMSCSCSGTDYCGTNAQGPEDEWGAQSDCDFTYNIWDCSVEGDWTADVRIKTYYCCKSSDCFSRGTQLGENTGGCSNPQKYYCRVDPLDEDSLTLYNIDWDTDASDCTCSSGKSAYAWFSTVSGGSGGNCCEGSDNFYYHSANPTTATTLDCRRCLKGEDKGTTSNLRGNGYWTGTTCYYGDITCTASSATHGTSGSTLCSAGTSTCCPNQGERAEGVSCNDGSIGGTAYDRDTSQARCEDGSSTNCNAQVWFSSTSGGSNNPCCGDDGSSDDFYYHSANPTTATTLDCRRCLNGADQGTTSNLHGNGYWGGTDKTTDTSGTCYHGDITCTASSAAHGASGTYYGNGYWTGTTCYYGDITCGDGSASHGTSGSTLCSAGTSTCCPNQGERAEGVSCNDGSIGGTAYDRDTSQARCEDGSSDGCTAYGWTGSQCCGDDGAEDFEDVGDWNSCCINGETVPNNDTDTTQQFLCVNGSIYGCGAGCGASGETVDSGCARRGFHYCDAATSTWKPHVKRGVDMVDCDNDGNLTSADMAACSTNYGYYVLNNGSVLTFETGAEASDGLDNDGDGFYDEVPAAICQASWDGPPCRNITIQHAELSGQTKVWATAWTWGGEYGTQPRAIHIHVLNTTDDLVYDELLDRACADTGVENDTWTDNSCSYANVAGDFGCAIDWSDLNLRGTLANLPQEEGTYTVIVSVGDGNDQCVLGNMGLGGDGISASADRNTCPVSNFEETWCVPAGYYAVDDASCCPVGTGTNDTYPGRDDDGGNCLRCNADNTQHTGGTGDGACEATCGADAQCDEYSLLTCPDDAHICAGSCTYTDRDTSQSYCEDNSGCTAYTWFSEFSQCCGDDGASDDFSMPGAGNDCCLDGETIGSGLTSNSDEMLCLDGVLYSCNNPTLSSGDIDHVTCNKKGDFYCTDTGWSGTGPAAEDCPVTCEEAGGTWFGGDQANEGCCESGEEFLFDDIIEDGLVSYFKFDSGSTHFSDDKGGLVAENNGSTVVTSESEIVSGNALSFDGSNDYLEVANDSKLQLDGDLTVAFWIKPDNVGSNRLNPLHKKVRGEFTFTIETDGALSVYHGSSAEGYNTFSALGSGTIVNGEWQFIAVTRDASTNTMKAYHNGHLEGNDAYTIAPSATSDPLLIGDGYTNNYGGNIDEVMIWSRPLSEGEVGVLYQTFPKPKQSDFSLHLSMDEGTGSTTDDGSYWDNDGVINGAEWDTNNYKTGSDSLEFNGTGDHVTAELPAHLSELTVAAWFKPNDTQTVAAADYESEQFDGPVGSDCASVCRWADESSESAGDLVSVYLGADLSGPFAIAHLSKVPDNSDTALAWRVEVYEDGAQKWTYTMDGDDYDASDTYQWKQSPTWVFEEGKEYRVDLYWPDNMDLYSDKLSVLAERDAFYKADQFRAFLERGDDSFSGGLYARGSGGSWSNWTADIQMPLDGWHHVAWTLNATHRRMLVDGVEMASTSGVSGLYTTAGNVTMGYGWRSWMGNMDDVRIYNRSLTTAEVNYIYGLETWARYACNESAAVKCEGGDECLKYIDDGDRYYCWADYFTLSSKLIDKCESACVYGGGNWAGGGGDQNCCSNAAEFWCAEGEGVDDICYGGVSYQCDYWCDVFGSVPLETGTYYCSAEADGDCTTNTSCKGTQCACLKSEGVPCNTTSECANENCIGYVADEPVHSSLGTLKGDVWFSQKVCCIYGACAYDRDGDLTTDSCAANTSASVDADSDGDLDYCQDGIWRECRTYESASGRANDCNCLGTGVTINTSGGWFCRRPPVSFAYDTELSCGSLCDSDSDLSNLEMLNTQGQCVNLGTGCSEVMKTSRWEGNTSLLTATVKTVCPCEESATCTFSVHSNGERSKNVFYGPYDQLASTTMDPDFAYGENNISLVCTCSVLPEACQNNRTANVRAAANVPVTECVAGKDCQVSVNASNIGSIDTTVSVQLEAKHDSTLYTNSSSAFVQNGTSQLFTYTNAQQCSWYNATWLTGSAAVPVRYESTVTLSDVSYSLTANATGDLVQCQTEADCTGCCSGSWWCWTNSSDSEDFTCSEGVCCGSGEHFQKGACCLSSEKCCLLDSDCNEDQWCDNYTSGFPGGNFFCRAHKELGYACQQDRECAIDYCGGGLCTDPEPVSFSEWYECAAGAGSYCDYQSTGRGGFDPQGCNSDGDCGSGYYCYTPRHACIACPEADTSYAGLNISDDGLCPSLSCLGHDLDCCSTDSDCSSDEWCDASASCTACSTRSDGVCTSGSCVGTDPDCCSTDGDCGEGLQCVSGTCTGNLGESCTSDSQCTGGLKCLGGSCAKETFMVLSPAEETYQANLGEVLRLTLVVSDPQNRQDEYTVEVDPSYVPDSAFVDVDGEKSVEFEMGDGEVRKFLVTVSAAKETGSSPDILTRLNVESNTNSFVNDYEEVKVDVSPITTGNVAAAPVGAWAVVLILGYIIGMATKG